MPEQLIALSNAVMTSHKQRSLPIQQSVFDAVPLAMQAYLYVVYGQHWIDKSLYCATFELYQASVVTDSHRLRGCVRSLCESVTTLTTSVVDTKRNDSASCPHGRPSISFDCQRCRNAAQV